MQHLNIPLSRHTKTTPPFAKGGVVWLLIAGLLAFGFFVSQVGGWWFGRGAILSMAPEGTILAIELQLTPKTKDALQKWLSGIPLISLRSLELEDLVPYVKGELAIFVNQDGHWSVGIERGEENLPEPLLDYFAITSQEQGRFLLLSSKLEPISGVDPISHPPFWPSFKKTWIGRVVLPDSKMGGGVYLREQELSIEFADATRPRPEPSRPRSGLALLFTNISWSQESSPLPALERLILPFYQESEGKPSFLPANASLSVIIRPTESGQDTLLVMKKTGITSRELIREMQIIGAFARPSIVTTLMPDGSALREVEVAPDLVSVEEVSTSLGLGYRVAGGIDSEVIALINGDEFVLSNSKALLDDYGSLTNSGRQEGLVCQNGNGYLKPDFFLSQIALSHFDPRISGLYRFFSNFSAISFETTKYSTTVRLCSV